MTYRRIGWIGDLFVIGIVSSVNCIESFRYNGIYNRVARHK